MLDASYASADETMTDSKTLLNEISAALPSLSKADKRIAAVILDAPEASTTSSIAVLAKLAQVSEPSVNRFCKKFGAKGFPDFKLKLTKCLASGRSFLMQGIEEGDSPAIYGRKVFDSTLNALSSVRDQLDERLIERVVTQLLSARRIYFFGLGASASVAKDAEHKFFRFDLPVAFHEDILMQRMLAAAAGSGDLFFLVSYTGRTRELLETAKLALAGGACVIAMTAPKSPLVNHASMIIPVDLDEDTEIYTPMTSRLVQLAMLDVLAAGVSLQKGAEVRSHVQKVKDSLKSTRIEHP